MDSTGIVSKTNKNLDLSASAGATALVPQQRLEPQAFNGKQRLEPQAFNGKSVKIVVAARQYRGGSILSRGYGDIASGVRALDCLQKLYPGAQFSFIFEHYSLTERELARLKTTATVPGVKAYILDGRKSDEERSGQQPWAQEHQEDEARQLLQDADFILHGPAGLISPIKNSPGQYAKKTVSISEYDRITVGYCDEICPLPMGFRYDRIYMVESPGNGCSFNNEILRTHLVNPASAGESGKGKNTFYFSYSHNPNILEQMLKVLVSIEGNSPGEVAFVVTGRVGNSFCEGLLREGRDRMLLPASCPYSSIIICGQDGNGEYSESTLFENPQGKHQKKIRLMPVHCLDNHDFQLLQKSSLVAYSSGDISTSDSISMGKIPMVDPYQKRVIYLEVYKKMQNFCCIAGNEVYQPLFDAWKLATSSFSEEGREAFPHKSFEEVSSLQQLDSPLWKEFEGKFTNWVRENNQTEAFLYEKAEAIITG